MKQEAIIFDFGGVLINIDYQATITAFKQLGITDFDALYSQANQSDLFDAIETGRISTNEFVKGILDLLPPDITYDQVVHAWNAMILDVPSNRIELLLKLKKSHSIYLLSNTNSIHIEKALIEWNSTTDVSIHELFDHVYLSHQMGMRKPNAEIFQFVCDQEGLTPEKTLFIDDSIQHIEGAKSIGLRTHHLLASEKIQDLFS